MRSTSAGTVLQQPGVSGNRQHWHERRIPNITYGHVQSRRQYHKRAGIVRRRVPEFIFCNQGIRGFFLCLSSIFTLFQSVTVYEWQPSIAPVSVTINRLFQGAWIAYISFPEYFSFRLSTFDGSRVYFANGDSLTNSSVIVQIGGSAFLNVKLDHIITVAVPQSFVNQLSSQAILYSVHLIPTTGYLTSTSSLAQSFSTQPIKCTAFALGLLNAHHFKYVILTLNSVREQCSA